MKKYLLLLLMAGIFTLSSCSSDDDGGDTTTGTDPIIGTWILTDINTALISIEECSEESTITFNEDNTGNATFYLETKDCEAQTSDGNWSEKDGLYTIDVPFLGELTGTAEFNEDADQFAFTPQNAGVTLTFERQ